MLGLLMPMSGRTNLVLSSKNDCRDGVHGREEKRWSGNERGRRVREGMQESRSWSRKTVKVGRRETKKKSESKASEKCQHPHTLKKNIE